MGLFFLVPVFSGVQEDGGDWDLFWSTVCDGQVNFSEPEINLIRVKIRPVMQGTRERIVITRRCLRDSRVGVALIQESKWDASISGNPRSGSL